MKILIDNGHGVNTPGKCSPDGRIKEWAYTREIAERVVACLRCKGYDAERIVTEECDVPLPVRCRRVNTWCDKLGKDNVVFVSIHLNAAGADGQWHQATGWEAYTSRGLSAGDVLANHLYDAAEQTFAGKKIRTDWTDGDRDKEAGFAVLNGTKCAAVLTENFFMDGTDDAQFLLSEKGKQAIVTAHVQGILSYIESKAKK